MTPTPACLGICFLRPKISEQRQILLGKEEVRFNKSVLENSIWLVGFCNISRLMPLQVLAPLRGNFLYSVTWTPRKWTPEHLRSRNWFIGYFPVFLHFLPFASDGTRGAWGTGWSFANSCWPQPGQGVGHTRLAAVTCDVVPRPFLTSLSSCCQSTMHHTRLGCYLRMLRLHGQGVWGCVCTGSVSHLQHRLISCFENVFTGKPLDWVSAEALPGGSVVLECKCFSLQKLIVELK